MVPSCDATVTVTVQVPVAACEAKFTVEVPVPNCGTHTGEETLVIVGAPEPEG